MANQADFAPALGALKDLRPFVFWAQTTLPTVFDDSLSYYEVLTKLCKMINTFLENENTNAENINALATAYQQLQDFTNNYFENLNITQEINDKIDALFADGTIPNLVLDRANTILNTYLYGEDGESGVNKDIEDLIADANADIALALSNFATNSNQAISQFELNGRGAIATFEGQVDAKIAGIDDIVEDWMDDNFTNPSSVVIDDTLTVKDAAADAYATGKLMDDAENMVLATAYWQNYMIEDLPGYYILADSDSGSNRTVAGPGAVNKIMHIANVTAGETYIVSGVASSYSGTRYIPAFALGNVTYDTGGNPYYELYDVYPRGWDDSVDPGTVYQYVRNQSVRIPTGTSIPVTHLFIMSDTGIPITARCSRLNVRTDDTLTSETLPAQGKATGDAIEALTTRVDAAEDGIVALENMMGLSGELPAEYKPAMYLETDGTALLDSGIGWTNHPKTVIDAYCTGGALFGNYHTGSKRYVGGAGENFAYGTTVVSANKTSEFLNTRATYSFSDTKLLVDGNTIEAYNATGANGSENHIMLFGRSYTGSGSGTTNAYASAGTRIYGCKMYVGNDMVLNAIPCVRIADNVAGFYDTVSESFITGSGVRAEPYKTVTELNEAVNSLESIISTTGLVNYSDIEKFGTDHVFTERFSVEFPFSGNYSNIVFTAVAGYTGESADGSVPVIYFVTGSGLSRTTRYELGKKDSVSINEWRVCRYPGNKRNFSVVFDIPAGTSVTIYEFTSRFDDSVKKSTAGIKIMGHRRMPFTPYDTMPGAISGCRIHSEFVEIPKRLSDGVWICYHDDSLVYNNTYIRQADGSELPSTYNGTRWSEIDFATANSWDWGVSYDPLFKGTKPMTVEDFFDLCSKTGVSPILSVHPLPSASELQELKALANKCGVLGVLGIKAPVSYINSLYQVFGNDIAMYVANVSAGARGASAINSAISALDAMQGFEGERVVELFASTAYQAYFGAGDYDPYAMIKDAGYTCSLAQQTGVYNPLPPASSTPIIWSYSMEWWYKEHGVKRFNDEYNYSVGLNW